MTYSGIYTVKIRRSAEKEMLKLDPQMFSRVSDSILKLENEPQPQGTVKLRSLDLYRIRVGQDRVTYSIDDGQHQVEVFIVGHRRDVYKDIGRN